MYQKLCGKREIRLMTLAPAQQASDPLVCHLRREQLNPALSYEALSYEWKEEEGFYDITCDSVHLSITRNLAAALQALRLCESPRVLWVDAICINQTDKEEKSKQIPLMRDIYASARSVLSWLGPSFPGVEKAFKIFPYLALVRIERDHPRRLDTEKSKDNEPIILQRPKHGSIIQSRKGYAVSFDRSSSTQHTIQRNPELDDDTIFKFDDDEVWKAIDRLLTSSYFQRSWIIQEVAVAEEVYVLCGQHTIPWEIFQLAHEGRASLKFQVSEIFRGSGVLATSFIQHARVRYRNYERQAAPGTPKCLYLGTLMEMFAFTKARDPRDRVYAALGIVNPPSLCWDIVPDYNKSVEDVFYEASCNIIQTTGELGLWSTRTLHSRRNVLGLPSWVPEWSMEPCIEAFEFASPKFSPGFRGNPEVQGRSLHVDGYLVDEVDKRFPINDESTVHQLVMKLDSWLQQHGMDMFSTYATNTSGFVDHAMKMPLSQEIRDEANQLLLEFDDLPPIADEAIRCASKGDAHLLNNTLLNIEAMSSTLIASSRRRKGAVKRMGYYLFLAIIYFMAKLISEEDCTLASGLPKAFNHWLMAAVTLSSVGLNKKMFEEIYVEHLIRHLPIQGRIEDCFFVTKKGLFGRAPAETVQPGQVVAVLGGTYLPCMLERRENHFRLVSHAYVEGIMIWESIPAQMLGNMQRIEIR